MQSIESEMMQQKIINSTNSHDFCVSDNQISPGAGPNAQLTVETSLSSSDKKYFCVLSNVHDYAWLRYPSEACIFLEVLLMSKGLREASLLGATFLVGLAALEAMLHLAGF